VERRELNQSLPKCHVFSAIRRYLSGGAGTLFRRTLLITLYGTGMRRAELARLKVSDIDSHRMMIRVDCGKGDRSRDLPLSPALLETLREYWRWRKPKSYLFPSRDPRRGPQQPISDKSVWLACQEVARQAIASWIGIDRASAFNSSKPFGPFSAAAPLPWAAIAILAYVAATRPSRTTRAEIGTAPSVRRKPASAGCRPASANSWLPPISSVFLQPLQLFPGAPLGSWAAAHEHFVRTLLRFVCSVCSRTALQDFPNRL